VSTLLRRLPLSRLLLLCATVLAVGIGATALALAVGAGPVPAPKQLPDAIHDALSASAVDGVSARIQLTNHLIEGASLAGNSGGEASQLASSPLLSGASGRLWVGQDGRARLELQSEKGDTQILYDGHNASLYDASTNTLYRFTPPPSGQPRGDVQGTSSDSTSNSQISGGFTVTSNQPSTSTDDGSRSHETPSVTKIEEGIEHLEKHAVISEAKPTDVGGQPAYTVRISPREHGGLIGGAELSWDAVHGVPLRAAVYSTGSSSPVVELAATEVSYGPLGGEVLDFAPPANATVRDVTLPSRPAGSSSGQTTDTSHPHLTLHGQGLESIALVESPVKGAESSSSGLEGLQKVDINGASASELPTALGTLLSFERAGTRYLLAGAVTPATIEAFARSL
jgi:outer membrane lipoprotein-sorting protein